MSWFSNLGAIGRFWFGRDTERNGAAREVARESMDDMPPLLAEISEFWFAKREGESVPDWIHFSPHAHTKFLPHIVLWEVVDGDFFARITGETVASLLPVKLANQRLQDVLADEISSWPTELDRAMSRKVPIYAEHPNAWIIDDEIVHSRAVHLPFRANHNEANRVLSVLSFETEPKLDL